MQPPAGFTILECVPVLAGLITAALTFRIFFSDFGDFLEALRLDFQWDIISLMRGEWLDSHIAKMKLGAWAGFAIFVGALAWSRFQIWFPSDFPHFTAPPH